MRRLGAGVAEAVNDEQRVLRISVAATVTLAAAGIAVGLVAGSTAIVFDGVHSLADAAMTGLALGVARRIAASNAADASGGRLHARFTMGLWHLEPIVLGLNGVLLTGAATYALVNAAGSLLTGGCALAFDAAMTYAGLLTVAALGMAGYTTRANRRVGSRLVARDEGLDHGGGPGGRAVCGVPRGLAHPGHGPRLARTLR